MIVLSENKTSTETGVFHPGKTNSVRSGIPYQSVWAMINTNDTKLN